MKLAGKATPAAKKAEKKEKSNFFTAALKGAPHKCQNCNKSLAGTMSINPTAIVAHILAKSKTSGVPSMATNPLNKVYLCGDCHTDMDRKGCDYIKKMKIFPLLRKRVVLMFDHIPDNERRRIPECLQPSFGLEEIAKGL